MATTSHLRHQDDDPEDQELENLLSDDDNDRLTDLEDDLELNHEKPIAPAEPPLAPKIKRSTAYLDGLRGVAALCVYTQHTIGGGDHERGFGDPDGPNAIIGMPFIRVFYFGGGAAVSIFFVLSGFVVTQTMVKLLRDDQRRSFLTTWASAMIRRPIRLYFPCWGVSLIIAFALHLPYNIYPAVPWLAAEPSIGQELVRWIRESWNYFQPFQHHGDDIGWYIYDLVVWTIPLELKGSYICYGLVALYAMANRSFGIHSPIHIWAIGSLLIYCGWLLQNGSWWVACFISGYALSILDIHALDEPLLDRTYTLTLRQRKITIPVTTIVLHIMFVVSWYLLSEPASAGHPEWSAATPGWGWLTSWIPDMYSEGGFFRYWDSWGAMIFVYVTLRVKWLQWIFGTRPLQYLGKVSFMLYLVHLPMAYWFSDRWWRLFGHIPLFSDAQWWDSKLWMPDWGLGKGLNVRWAVGWTSVLLIDIGVAHLFTKFLDDPCVKLGKLITGLLRLNPPPKKPIKLEDQAVPMTELPSSSTAEGPLLPR